MDENSRIKYYVLASMSNKLPSQHEHMPIGMAMITHLQELYREQSHIVHFEVSKRLFNMKMHKGQSVHDYCMTVIKDIEELEKLGLNMQKELQMNLILQSLTSSYSQFNANFYINKLDYTISKLVNMFVTTEKILKNSRGTVLAVERSSSFKRKSHWKKKKKKNKPTKKQKKDSKPKKDVLKKIAVKEKYFHYDADGH